MPGNRLCTTNWQRRSASWRSDCLRSGSVILVQQYDTDTHVNALPAIERARLALDGLSVGDAFGQQFFTIGNCGLGPGEIPPGPWRHTDDTAMASAVFQNLRDYGEVQQDRLAAEFVRRFQAEPHRQYGYGTRELLEGIAAGRDWRHLSRDSFGGKGSFGNGAAMRVAPLGAYFSEDFARVADEAACQAEITHAHPEGLAGAIAVAIATAWAFRWQLQGRREDPRQLLESVVQWTPAGVLRDRLQQAQSIEFDEGEHVAAAELGNGQRISAVDTVPFCLWSAAAHLDDFDQALWATVRVRGDIDTNCAIVGGIVAMSLSAKGIPPEWLYRREPLWIDSHQN